MTDVAFNCMNTAHISVQHNQAKAPYLARHWTDFTAKLALWRQRAQARHALVQMSERDLKDIGLSQTQAVFEANKPFWAA